MFNLDLLKDKYILFFSVQFFNFEIEIKKTLEKYGAKVIYYDERPSNSNISKGIIRIKRDLLQKKINQHYNKILQETIENNFDYLFLIKGEVMPDYFLIEFKKAHPNCKIIFYTWDSFSNNSNSLKILEYFDRSLTFDSEDAKQYNLKFRPLFFLNSYRQTKEVKKADFKYDLLSLGTAHSDRYLISNKILEWCDNNNLSSYYYYYMQGRIVYFLKRIFDKNFKYCDYSKLSFDKLSTNRIIELYQESKVILDINHPWQKGLTMRTFESIGARRKLITTNKEIKKYPFYNSNNFYIIDRNEITLDKSFFETDYIDISDEMYERCSIDGWLYDIFFNERNDWDI